MSRTWRSVMTGGGEVTVGIMPLRQVAAKPLQHLPPGVICGGSVIARPAVVEKRMVGIGFDDDVVDQSGALEGRFCRRLG